jgi:quercetin dioxygenase-like cupin family protein
MIPGATSGGKLLQHPGEELVHVTSGEVFFHVGGQDYILKPGDSLHFNGEVPHHWENVTDKPAELIWMVLRSDVPARKE